MGDSWGFMVDLIRCACVFFSGGRAGGGGLKFATQLARVNEKYLSCYGEGVLNLIVI